ncbi:MAG: HEPN-associated N-terminal domain-containing protein [Pseudomonadota bacterium]|nr:HEPN-associated N-terminal domain-containing protein [Pseudomonadota bacterium]
MGGAKRMMEEAQDRGFSLSTNTHVCSTCMHQDGLKEFIDKNFGSNTCSYCRQTGKNIRALNFNKLVEYILECIRTEWGDPANEGLAYETREGGWQGEVLDTYEILQDLIEIDNLEILRDIASSILNGEWCQLDPYGLPYDRELVYGWKNFCSFVINRSRYLFLISKDNIYVGTEDSASISPSEILDALARIVEEMKLIRKIPSSQKIIRIRIFDPGEEATTAKSLGSPPAQFAKIPNRMSPAGIPMFYGAFEEKTAVLETYLPTKKKKVGIGGVFKANRDLVVLDLSAGRYLPSIFDEIDKRKRTSAKFLINFIKDFSKPIDREDRAHIDYVPTQVVTEYFRHIFKLADGKSLDGIIYPSSKKGGKNAVVIFADTEHCVERASKMADGALLWLEKTIVIDLEKYSKRKD